MILAIVDLYNEAPTFDSLFDSYCALLSEKTEGAFALSIAWPDTFKSLTFGTTQESPATSIATNKKGYRVSIETSSQLSQDEHNSVELMAKLLLASLLHKETTVSATANGVLNNLSILFHDIRNLLGNIGGIVQLLEMDSDQNNLDQSVQDISSVVDRFEERIANDLLFYRKGVLAYVPTSVDLSALYETILSKRKRVFELSDVALKYNVTSDLVATVDNEYAGVVLRELLSNAFDALENVQNGHVSVEIISEDTMCQIVVQDNGVGVSHEIKPHIFKKFFTTKTKRRGVGLSIISQCLSDWGGTISIDSAVGQGTTAPVQFPLQNIGG